MGHTGGGAFSEASINPALYGQPDESCFSTRRQSMSSFRVTEFELTAREAGAHSRCEDRMLVFISSCFVGTGNELARSTAHGELLGELGKCWDRCPLGSSPFLPNFGCSVVVVLVAGAIGWVYFERW
jgi:hypothetical protein